MLMQRMMKKLIIFSKRQIEDMNPTKKVIVYLLVALTGARVVYMKVIS